MKKDRLLFCYNLKKYIALETKKNISEVLLTTIGIDHIVNEN